MIARDAGVPDRAFSSLVLWLTAILVAPPTAAADEPGAPVDALVEAPRSNRAALFDDELALLERAVVGWLEERSDLRVRLLPASTRDTLAAPECAALMRSEDVIRERLGRVARVSITATCLGEPPCELRVRVSRPPVADGAYERLHEWRAEVPSGAGEVTRFIAALPDLREPPPPSGSLLGTLRAGHDPDRRRVRVDWVAPAGRWPHAPTPASIAEAVQPALDACHAEGWSHGGTEHAVLAFAQDGSVARCEARLRREPQDAARATCLCRALSGARVSRGAPGRRVEIGIMNRPSSGVLAGDVTHHASFRMTGGTGGFRAYPGFARVQEPVARCFAMAGITEPTRVGLRVFVDPRGAMTRAEIDGTGLSPEISRCLQGVLGPLAFTCPAGGGAATWTGQIHGYTVER